jgi:hypothetical protein
MENWQIITILVLFCLFVLIITCDYDTAIVQRGYAFTPMGAVYFEMINHKVYINKTYMRSANGIENFEAPDYLPEKNSLLSNVYDNIVGRMPGVDGIGIKKIKTIVKVDNKEYIVRDVPNFQEAAETLAKINSVAMKLIKYLQDGFPNSEYTIELSKNYDGKLSEETPKNLENLTSYTVNKEEIISCLRTKDSQNKLHDYNLLLYVFIHEMSHMANGRSFGHNEDFELAFEFLLKRADEIGILKRIDFEKNPQNFCGLPITVNIDY